jgi:hypothetical protein
MTEMTTPLAALSVPEGLAGSLRSGCAPAGRAKRTVSIRTA